VYPAPFLNPIAGYVQGIFAHTPNVLPLPTAGGGGSSNGGGGEGSERPSAVGDSGVASANSNNVAIEAAGVHHYKNVMVNSQKFSNNVIHSYNYDISSQYEDNNNNNNYNIGLIKISSALKGAVATTTK
jgi:hypothetical protein